MGLRVSVAGASGYAGGELLRLIAGHPHLEQTCRLEENVLVTANGPVVFTRMEHMEEAMK